MGYDASVWVIFGSRIEDSGSFLRQYLERHPEVVATGTTEGLNMSSPEEAFEYIENYLDDYEGYGYCYDDAHFYIFSFGHEHSVLRTKDPVKRLELHTEENKESFRKWCLSYSIPPPEFMTIVIDG